MTQDYQILCMYVNLKHALNTVIYLFIYLLKTWFKLLIFSYKQFLYSKESILVYFCFNYVRQLPLAHGEKHILLFKLVLFISALQNHFSTKKRDCQLFVNLWRLFEKLNSGTIWVVHIN